MADNQTVVDDDVQPRATSAPERVVVARERSRGLTITGIVIGAVLVAGVLFGGGVALGLNLPRFGGFAPAFVVDRPGQDRGPWIGHNGERPGSGQNDENEGEN